MTKTKPKTETRIITIDRVAARLLLAEDARYKSIPGFNRGQSETQENGNRYSVSLVDCPHTGGSAYLLIIERGAFSKGLIEAQATMDPRNERLAQMLRDFETGVFKETIPTTFEGVEIRIVNEI